MSESDLRQRTILALKSLDAFAVENPIRPGTPDVNYIYGWLELKYLPGWPKGELTPVVIPHFTPQQRIWLARRARHGGIVHVLLQVGRTWLLLDGEVAAEHLGKATQTQLYALAVMAWHNKFDSDYLLHYLSRKIPGEKRNDRN